MDNTQTDKFKSLLATRRDELMRVIIDAEKVIHEQLSPAESGESKVDFNHPADMDSEAGDPDYEKEMNLLERQRAELTLVNQALWRLDHDRFGVCEACEEEIAPARLEALPYTRFCVACSQKAESDLASEQGRPGIAVPRSLPNAPGAEAL